MQAAGEKMGVKDASDWRRVSKAELVQSGAGELLLDGRSMEEVLASLPDEEGKITGIKRGQAPRGHWDVDDNCRDFLLACGKLMGLKSLDDWISADAAVLRRLGGDGLLRKGPIFHMVQKYVIEHVAASEKRSDSDKVESEKGCVEGRGGAIDARLQLFKRSVPKGFWLEQKNRRHFLELVAAHFDVKSPEGWRRVRRRDVRRLGGEQLLALYPSFYAALEDTFPEMEWNVLRCRAHVPLGYWDDEKHVRDFIKHLEVLYHLEKEEDWLRVSRDQVIAVDHGSTLLKRMPLKDALRVVYPDRNWEGELKMSSKRAAQRWMHLQVAHLFADTQPLTSGALAPAGGTIG